MGFLNDKKREDEVRNAISVLRLLDDVLATAALNENLKATQEILSVITKTPKLTVIYAETQKTVTNLKGRSARFDLVAIDSKRNVYNLEIQRATSGGSAKRARYNSSLMDTQMLDPGEPQTKLKKSVMIFFMEKDFFGEGLPIYHVERKVRETGKPFSDGSVIIYVNGEYKNDKTKIGRLIHDFRQTNPNDMFSEVLADAVRKCKYDEEGVRKIMGIMEEFEAKAFKEGKKEGKKEGMQEEKTATLIRMLDAEVEMQMMVKILGVSEKTIKKMIKELNR